MIQSTKKEDAIARKRGRPSAENQANLKQVLLFAAVELFGARGYDGVSLGQIAKRVGSDIGLIRYYFGSKSEVWQAAMLYLIDQFANESDLDRLNFSGAKSESLKGVTKTFISASSKWSQLSRILVFDGDNNDERGVFVSQKLVGPFYQILSGLIAGAKSEDIIPDVETRTIFFMITHGGSFPMVLPALTNAFPGGDILSESVINKHADAIIKLIFKK